MTDEHKFYRAPANEHDARIHKVIRREVRHKGVLATVLPAGDAGGLPKAATLRAAVEKAGLSECTFLDYHERTRLAQRCQDTGKAALCYRVGELYAKQKIYPSEEHVKAPAYFERACVNGSTKACARRAEWSGGDVKWLERACRRGHKPSCARLAVDKPHSPTAKLVKTEPAAADGVVAKVKKVYLPSIIDCFEAYAQTRSGSSKGKVAFKFTISDHGVADVRANAFDASVATCLKRQIKRWVFTGARLKQVYKFCYELEGKSMISRRLPPLHHLLGAPGQPSRRSTGPVFGRSRRARVALRPASRKRYARVSVYSYGRRVGQRTTLSRYTARSALYKRRYYLARCFQRHVMKSRYQYYSTAYAYYSLTVGPNGRPTRVHIDRVTRYYGNKAWQRCLEREIKRTQFPAPKRYGTSQPASASFTGMYMYFSTTTYRPYRAAICDFDAF